MKISASKITAEKIIEIIMMGIWGNKSSKEPLMAPKSAPIFIILAIRRRDTIGRAIFFEYFLDIIDVKPLPVTIPILAQIPTITVMNG